MEELNIKETQKIALELLHTIAHICEIKGLRYYLMYGTLIGAIRHKGYIPWDDDTDIMMPRPDYDILLEYLHKNINKYPNLEVFNHDTNKGYPYMITRISDNRYVTYAQNEVSYGLGVFIDIYPFDGLGNNKKEALKYGLKGDRLSSICYQATRKHFTLGTTTKPIRKIIKYPFFIFSKLIGKDRIQDMLESLARKKQYDNSKYVGCIVWLSGGMKDIFEKKWFDNYIMVPFENYNFRVPKNYDTVLRHMYGDYMLLPQKKDRIGHHNYSAYKK